MLFVSDIAKLFFSKLPNSSFKIPFGHMKGVHWLVSSANPGQAFGRYEPEHEAHFIKLLDGTHVFWDVGAHVGWYSLMAAKYLPSDSQIISFEPNPDNLVFLKKHFELNPAANVVVAEFALCDNDGEALFSNCQSQSQLTDDGSVKVATRKADSLLDNNFSAPDFIKIDVEGAELAFLRGAGNLIKTYRPIILLSAHGYLLRDQCMAWLNQHHYDFEHLVSNQKEGDYVFLASPT